MKAVRRFGLIIAVLFLGLLIGKLSSLAIIMIFSGLFVSWFMFWDEREYQKYCAQYYAQQEAEQSSFQSEAQDEFHEIHYISYETRSHKSA